MKRIQLNMTEEKVHEIEAAMETTGVKTKKEFFNLALSLLQWAIKEKKSGRIIASLDEDNNKLKEIVMPI